MQRLSFGLLDNEVDADRVVSTSGRRGSFGKRAGRTTRSSALVSKVTRVSAYRDTGDNAGYRVVSVTDDVGWGPPGNEIGVAYTYVYASPCLPQGIHIGLRVIEEVSREYSQSQVSKRVGQLLIAPAGLLSGLPGGAGNVSRIGSRFPD